MVCTDSFVWTGCNLVWTGADWTVGFIAWMGNFVRTVCTVGCDTDVTCVTGVTCDAFNDGFGDATGVTLGTLGVVTTVGVVGFDVTLDIEFVDAVDVVTFAGFVADFVAGFDVSNFTLSSIFSNFFFSNSFSVFASTFSGSVFVFSRSSIFGEPDVPSIFNRTFGDDSETFNSDFFKSFSFSSAVKVGSFITFGFVGSKFGDLLGFFFRNISSYS